MLTIGKLGSSPDQLGYYEQQVAQGMEDYFSGRGEAPGRWAGTGAALLGVAGQVDRGAFMRAMEGRDPRSGERLKPEHGRAKVAAFDLTFSAPKSVSVLFAIADERTSMALMDAHRRAVAAAFAYIEHEACFTRRGHNGVRRVRGDGFLAAAYRHRLSRAGDPQLHTHVVVANMTCAEGRWTSLEAHGLYEHKLAAGALYRAVLRAEVRERLPWVSWRLAGRGLFEIDGVPHGVLREFSRRRVEIEERARELTGMAASMLSRERLQGIALQTRKAKEYAVDGARWQAEARARAAEHGLGQQELARLCDRRIEIRHGSEVEVARSAAARLSGPAGLTAQHNTFARRHALAEVAGEFVQGASVEQVQRATGHYLDHTSVVGLGRLDNEPRFTTRDLLACEQAIVDGARRRVGERSCVLDERLVDAWLGRLAEPLSEEQATAARALAGVGQGVSMLEALAGTGKTRVLSALAKMYGAAGYQVLGVAATGRAARELGDAAQIPASTIQRLVADLQDPGALAARTVVLLDEAGTAPTRPSAALFALAEQASVKVIAVGDSGQLPAVAAGGWFATLARELGGPELREVMRQRDPAERDALERLHDGDPLTLVAVKHDRRELGVFDLEAGALRSVLADWDRARSDHGISGAVMIARDNVTRDVLNQDARRLLANVGLLGQGVTIADQEFRLGERVIARRNDRHREIDNGTLASITQIDERTGTLTLLTDSGKITQLDAPYAAEHLEYGYALTGHGAQGATVEWAGVVGRPSEFTREWSYTALSRARAGTRVYLIAEATESQREREQYAPPEPQRTSSEALEIMTRAMRRRESEPLALDQVEEADLSGASMNRPSVPLANLPEAGAEWAGTIDHGAQAEGTPPSATPTLAPEPDWRTVRAQRGRGHERDIER